MPTECIGNLFLGDFITACGYFTQFFYASGSAWISYMDVTILKCDGVCVWLWIFLPTKAVGTTYTRGFRYANPPVPGGELDLIICSEDGFHYISAIQ